jgi:hypothetical protein
MARRSKQPSRTQLRTLLRESEFDPRQTGTPLSIAIEEMNPGYCELKSLELIKEARVTVNSILSDEDERKLLEYYNEKIARAISLLVYARALRNGSVQAKA